MAATLSWRDAIPSAAGVDNQPSQDREAILAQVSSPEAVQEALAEVSTRMEREAQEALVYADLAYDMAQRVGMPKLLSAAARMRGKTLRALSRHEAAVDALEAAARYALESGDEVLALQSRMGIVDSLGWLDRYAEAIELAHHLEEQLLVRGEMAEAAKVFVNEGNLHHRQDNYHAALEAFDRALEMLQGRADEAVIAQVQVNRANALTHLNRVHEATELYEQARKVFAARNEIRACATVDLNLGFLRYISGEHSAAIKAFTRARNAFLSLNR